ncbi:hypothetical protein [Corynebacterium senegalense]|uniref:hypothetical protein n=1 Tax=Corynebacterium senegalense TaxID=2080750 RepID=UPI0011C0415E|nr:hypothetical protein [Corynebacterium senegalense]
MKSLRDKMNADPQLKRALQWNADDPTLSGREAALARIVTSLSTDFDALDGSHQRAIADALVAQAKETQEAESYADRLIRRSRQ